MVSYLITEDLVEPVILSGMEAVGKGTGGKQGANCFTISIRYAT